jgi:hypothetical protein
MEVTEAMEAITAGKMKKTLVLGILIIALLVSCAMPPVEIPEEPSDETETIEIPIEDPIVVTPWTVTDGDRTRHEQISVNMLAWKTQDPDVCNSLENKTFETGLPLQETALLNLPKEIDRCLKFFYAAKMLMSRDPSVCEPLRSDLKEDCLNKYERIKDLPPGKPALETLQTICNQEGYGMKECMALISRDSSYCSEDCADEKCLAKVNNCLIFSSDPDNLSAIKLLTPPDD